MTTTRYCLRADLTAFNPESVAAGRVRAAEEIPEVGIRETVIARIKAIACAYQNGGCSVDVDHSGRIVKGWGA